MNTYYSPMVKQYLQNNLKKHALLPAKKKKCYDCLTEDQKEQIFLIILKNWIMKSRIKFYQALYKFHKNNAQLQMLQIQLKDQNQSNIFW